MLDSWLVVGLLVGCWTLGWLLDSWLVVGLLVGCWMVLTSYITIQKASSSLHNISLFYSHISGIMLIFSLLTVSGLSLLTMVLGDDINGCYN